MALQVALLRGINVGGHRVPMARLREAFEELGFTGVRTFIASGNVVFDGGRKSAASLERTIEAHLASVLGFDVPTLLRTPAELHAIVDRVPFSEADVAAAHAVHVIFLREPLDRAAAAALPELDTPRDRFATAGREIYWWCGGPLSETLVPAKAFGRVLGPRVTTMRNMTMLRRLAATL
jgi:uncharacterized protein (DUF1697 family)